MNVTPGHLITGLPAHASGWPELRHGMRRALVACGFTVVFGGALAAPHPASRLDDIAIIAEQHHAQARTLLVQEGPALIAGAPYAVRIRYLFLLRRVQVDGGN